MRPKGIIISPPFTHRPNGVDVGGNLSDADLRKYLLYWDKIDYPTNNIIHIASCPNISYLESVGVLTRTKYVFSGSGYIDGYLFIRAQQYAYEQHDAREQGVWSLAQISESTYYTDRQEEMGVQVALQNCLPVPQKDVPFDDILNFKQRHKDELIALHCTLGDLYENIISAKDIPHAKDANLNRLELAIKDLDKSFTESGIRKIYTPIIGTLELGEKVFPLAIASPMLGIDPKYATYGVCAGTVAFILKKVYSPKSPNNSNIPVTYINSAKSKLIL